MRSVLFHLCITLKIYNKTNSYQHRDNTCNENIFFNIIYELEFYSGPYHQKGIRRYVDLTYLKHYRDLDFYKNQI